MQHLRKLGAVAMLGVVVVAACGGGSPTAAPGATQSGGGGGGGGGATQQPAETQDGGGGGGTKIDFTYGKLSYQISGPVEKSGEVGFLPPLSLFGGSQGSTFYFADNAEGGPDGNVVSIIVGADGSVVVSYIGVAGQIPGATCTTSDWNVGSTSASGKFDCTAEISITSSGAAVAGGKIKGEFTAHT